MKTIMAIIIWMHGSIMAAREVVLLSSGLTLLLTMMVVSILFFFFFLGRRQYARSWLCDWGGGLLWFGC